MSQNPLIGRILRNHYEIIQSLGSGAFGDTYLAVDLDLPGQPQCVVKHLKPKDPNPNTLPIAKSLFDREAQMLYQLGNDSKQIPRLFAHFEENGEFYLVQEFIDGHDLSYELTPGSVKGENVVVKLLKDILEVLAFVHQHNVIHRDLKPQNIMRRRADGKIVLIDFGAVKEIGFVSINSTGQTSFTVTIGSPGYMPSEQAKGKPRLCSDVYAVGMIGIHALTGLTPQQLPEDPTTGEVIWRHLAQVSDSTANVLDKMVREQFSQRYQSATEALSALETLTNSGASLPPNLPQSTEHIPTPKRINRKQFFQWAGFGGAGLVMAFFVREILANFGSNSLKNFDFQVVTVNSQGEITQRQSGKAKYFTENLGNGLTLDMVQIPSGSFIMGAPKTEQKSNDHERPQHQVNIKHFFLSKCTVTQAQWRAVAALPSIHRQLNSDPSNFKGSNLPVEKISWHDASEFCKRLSKFTGRNYQLPSEAQWEYACRAGTTTPFHFGETITPELANYNGNDTYASGPKGIYRQKTTPVGSFPPNAFGLYDMHGNVLEWCADSWHDNYNGAPTNGIWDGDRSRLLLRGGSWVGDTNGCRSACRNSNVVDYTQYDVGFRVVFNILSPNQHLRLKYIV